MTEFDKRLNADFQALVEVTRVIQDLWAENTSIPLDHDTFMLLDLYKHLLYHPLALFLKSNPTLQELLGECDKLNERLSLVRLSANARFGVRQSCNKTVPCSFHFPDDHLLVSIRSHIVDIAKKCPNCGDSMERGFTETGQDCLGIWHPWNCVCWHEDELHDKRI